MGEQHFTMLLVRSPHVVKHLIQKGCDWRVKDEGGNTALEFMLKRPLDYINFCSCSPDFYSLLNSSKMAISSEMNAEYINIFSSLVKLSVAK